MNDNIPILDDPELDEFGHDASDPACECEGCWGEHIHSVRAKWTIDGAETFAEAANMAHAFGDWLQKLHDHGGVLMGPVDGDYGHFDSRKVRDLDQLYRQES